MPHEVFISHSQQDSQVAADICAALERDGIRCWIAPRDIVAGRNWGASIVQAIGASRLMVLVFSTHSNGSSQVLREVERATSRNVAVVLDRIEPVEPSSELEYYLSFTHWLNAFGSDHDKSLMVLLRTVRNILGLEEVRPAPVTPPPAVASGTSPDSDPAQYRSCPYCAERIRVDARICRFCNRDVTPTPMASAVLTPSSAAPAVIAPSGIALPEASSHDAPAAADSLIGEPRTAASPVVARPVSAPLQIVAPVTPRASMRSAWFSMPSSSGTFRRRRLE